MKIGVHSPAQLGKRPAGLILSPTSRKRLQYVALMMLGIGIMFFAITGWVDKDAAAVVGGWGIGFLMLSVVLLMALGITAVVRQLSGVDAHDGGTESKNIPPDDGSLDSRDAVLSDTERALINLLRSNDVPPDVVAQSIREALERRMGR